MEPELASWKASRFNVQATMEDGKLVVWNTLRGAITTFPEAEAPKIKCLLTRRPFEAHATGMVDYLRRRGFLVKADVDEYQNFQFLFGRQHYRADALELTLLSSEDCNFRCEYCYEKFARGTMRPWVRSAIKKFTEARLSGLRFLNINWFGGEPLYGLEAIEDLAPFFHQLAAENSIHLDSTITTNGYLLTPPVVDKLLAWGVKTLQVTIDGAPEDHNRLRHGRNGEETFTRVFENIRYFRDRTDDFTLLIRVNFDPQSHPRIVKLLDMLGEEFSQDKRVRLLLRAVGRWGGDNDENLDVCGTEERKDVVNALVEEARKRGLGNYDDLRKMGRLGSNTCYASRPYQFIFGADGKIMKCTVALDTEEHNIVGHIGADGEVELDEDLLARWCNPVFHTEKKCQNCVVLPMCQSMSCPAHRVRGNEMHCPPIRANLKSSLFETQRSAMVTIGPKKVVVDSAPAVAMA